MASHLAAMLTFPPGERVSAEEYDMLVKDFYKELKDMPNTAFTASVEKKRILDMLDPAVNSLAYLFALLAIKTGSSSNKALQEQLLERAVLFTTVFDQRQIRFAGMQWRHLFEWMCDAFRKRDIRDLSPLSAAMLHLDPIAATFTTNHLAFLRLCLDMGLPRQALPILDRNLLSIPHGVVTNSGIEVLSDDEVLSNAFMTKGSGFTVKVTVEYLMEYYLLGAQTYVSLRKWDRARLFLEQVILTPCQGGHNASMLQLEAYKKWVMVGLLAQGNMFNQPRTADTAILTSIRRLSRAYETLADAFEKRNWLKFQAEMEQGASMWDNDGNLRLVREASEALLKYRVVDLQKTYAALPVTRVAHSLDFTADETHAMLTNMIQTGHVNASITPSPTSASSDAVLRFHVLETSGPSAAQQDEQVEVQTKRIEDLVKYINDADRQLQLTKEFVDVAKRNRKMGPDSDPTDQMDLDYSGPSGSVPGLTAPSFEEEEDLMVR